MTLRIFDALKKRHEHDEAKKDSRAALVAWVIANTFRGQDTPPYEFEDFMPGDGAAESEELSPEDRLTKLRSMNALLGGNEVEK